MQKQFVTYEIALKFKELGFNDPCLGIYVSSFHKPNYYLTIEQELNWKPYNWRNKNYNNGICTAPLWQQAIDWLRKRHNMWIVISKKYEHFDNEIDFYVLPNRGDSFYKDEFRSYRKAREQAILKALEIVKNNK